MEFTVAERKITLGNRKGQTGFQAVPVGTNKISLDRLVDIVVDETSLGAGDVRNAIITMTKITKRYLSDGISVDLGELGSLRVNVSSKILSDPLEVTAAKALQKPKIVYTPRHELRDAVAGIKLKVNNPYRQSSSTTPEGGDTASGGGSVTPDPETPGGDTPGGDTPGGDTPGLDD